MRARRTLALALAGLALALAGAGIFRNELKIVVRNARAVCYSCIGLQ
jgi:hypothetical protein